MILETVLATIRRNTMFVPEDRVLVAVSGGPDSVALLHLLLDLRTVLPLSLIVGHLDHALRNEESKRDRTFVEKMCRDRGLECVSAREEVAVLARKERRSIEEAGRVARRRFLQRVARERNCRRVAFGHQRDDQAESVLLRLVAGAGRGGLSGIKPVSEGLFVRPLLDCGRSEILRYLEDRGVGFQTDSSNTDCRFPRNRMRHGVLPLLAREFNPRVVEAVARTADLLREEDAFLERAARRVLRNLALPPGQPGRGPASSTPSETKEPKAPPSSAVSEAADPSARALGDQPIPANLVESSQALNELGLSLDARALSRLAPAIGRRVMRMALRHAGLRGRDLAKARIDEILQLASRNETNVSLCLGESLVARLEYGRLILKRDPGRGNTHGDEGNMVGSLPGDGERPEGQEAAYVLMTPSAADGAAVRSENAASGLLVTSIAGSGHSGHSVDGAGVHRRPPILHLPLPGIAEVEHLGMILRSRIVPVESVIGEYERAPSNRAYLDADLLETRLLIRHPRAGDRFRPLGAPGTRKLSDVWTDLRLTHEARKRCLLVESAGRIAWAVGLRPGHPFRVTDRTRRVAVLESLPLERLTPEPRQTTADASCVRDGRPDALFPEPARMACAPPSEASPPGEPSRSGPQIEAAPSPRDPDADGPGSASTQRPVLYTSEQIADAVDRIAREVSEWARGRELVLLGVLHGSFIFLSDLLRRLTGPVRVGFLDRAGALISRGLVLQGARVLVVEDILDTGESLVRVLARVQEHRPLEIRTCVLFDKVNAVRAVPLELDYRGLPVPDLWVVGYGLDHDGRERNLPYLTHV